MNSTQQPVAELIAQELHRNYRAAFKALHTGRNKPGSIGAPKNCTSEHDHGWDTCGKKDYFRGRAELLIKRAHVENPETLGEAEQILAATVLLRRLSVEGKLVVPVGIAYATGGVIPPGCGTIVVHHCSGVPLTDAALKQMRDAMARQALWPRTNAIAGENNQRGVR